MQATSKITPQIPTFMPCSLTIQFTNLDDLLYLWHCLNVSEGAIVDKSLKTKYIVNIEKVTGVFQVWNEVNKLVEQQKVS